MDSVLKELIIDEIDNHIKPEHRLFIDYRYQSINWHRLSSIDRLIFRSSVSSIGNALLLSQLRSAVLLTDEKSMYMLLSCLLDLLSHVLAFFLYSSIVQYKEH